jgi:hypothetical protein
VNQSAAGSGETIRAVDIIRKKRDGHELSNTEIETLVHAETFPIIRLLRG